MTIKRGNTATVKVQHWQLGLLQDSAQVYGTQREMWFPQILFRAVNEYWNEKPFGALILLAGAKNCGKSVLSLMSMARESFDPTIITDGFVHVTEQDPRVVPEHLLRTLDALDVLRKQIPPDDFTASNEILPTNDTDLSNLKSSYLWLPPTVTTKQAKTASMGGLDFLKYILESFLPQGASIRSRNIDHAPTHLVIALFDTAGELWQARDRRLMALRTRTDTLAIVLDATAISFFKDPRNGSPIVPESPNSAWVSSEWLEIASTSAHRRCLIVTKLDLLLAQPNARSYVEAVRKGETPPQPPRELLLGWLSETDPAERRLKHQIQVDADMPVFFVWTEDLSSPGKMPRTHGLVEFVNWCVDRRNWMTAAAGVRL